MDDATAEDVGSKVAAALSRNELVRVSRGGIDPSGLHSEGYLLDASDQFILLHRLSDRIDLDGYEVLRLKDVTKLEIDFPRKRLFEKALKMKSISYRRPMGVQLTNTRALLSSVSNQYPLIVIERELRAPGECEVGRIKLLTDEKYALKWLSPDSKWEDDPEVYDIADVTRVQFDGEYENTLALVAGIVPRQRS